MTPDQLSARASIAARKRHNPDDPSLPDAERDYRASRLESYIRDAVDHSPALTPDQSARLAAVLGARIDPARGS